MTEVIVLGAGMVGVSTALALQARGHQVLLADRRGIGRETSYGNAGAIQTEAVEPYGFPRDLSSLLRIGLGLSNDVNWHLSALPEFAGPLQRYREASRPENHQRATRLYAQLIRGAAEAHRPLTEAAGMTHLMEYRGYRALYRSEAAFAAARSAAEQLTAAFGIPALAEDSAALAAAEPDLQIALPGAIRYPGVQTCRSPGALTAAYGRLFQARGGRFVYADAQSLCTSGAGWQLRSEEGLHEAEHAVVALGPWSDSFVARFGYRIPMLRKRGYHRHYETVQGPRSSLLDAERGVFMARMNQGLRLTTGAELTHRDGRIDRKQLWASEASARELFVIGRPVEEDPWFGDRPFVPDLLPVLGAAPHHPGLWFHFGHGHQGFTAGPLSGEVFAGHFDGEVSELTEGLSPRRFL